MAFLQDEDAARAFEAALSFVDEYAFQVAEHALSGAPSPARAAQHSFESSAMVRAESSLVIGPQPPEMDDKMQRRVRANANKRLLRKAGLYDDPNRARKECKLEMTYLRRKFEQLQHAAVWTGKEAEERALETRVQARIKQQMAEFSALSNPKLGRCFTGQALDFRADINDFKGLLAELEKARREVGAVFAANRFNTTESSHHGVQLRSKKGANGMHLEGMKKHGGNGNLYDKAAKSLDTPYTIIEDYAKELFANSARADVGVKQIVRRYVEADRELIILVASVSPVSIAHEPLAGLTFDYRCYALIKRAAAATEDHDLSLLQMCTLASLQNEEGRIYDPAYMRALSNFVLGNTAGNIKADQELIENTLVEQVLNQRARY
ncbi:hypothetical protein PI124_g15830 [Phytophthora idaei]|nr:hypothetical protein PI124_g15830 [Phytophthora idaei]